jgi:hypothetical protein
VGFEPTISAGERLQIYTVDRAATGTGVVIIVTKIWEKIRQSQQKGFLFLIFWVFF